MATIEYKSHTNNNCPLLYNSQSSSSHVSLVPRSCPLVLRAGSGDETTSSHVWTDFRMLEVIHITCNMGTQYYITMPGGLRAHIHIRQSFIPML